MPAFFLQQDVPAAAPVILEITGVNAAAAPEVTLTVSVTDAVGQTVAGLDASNFKLGGALSEVAQIVRAERVTEADLPFAIVLVIDTSSSMAGTPLARTQAAAKAFVSALGENDEVALVTFDNDPQVLREFTSDKADVLSAIDGLNFGGQTALYDGAYTAIDLASKAPYPRRAVILLSDGAEYGGASLSGRAAAPEFSPVAGVPVYTIGLGFGLDRSYLRDLSDASSARFYESPTPEELAGIYADLAALFRSQYVVTLNFDGPLDGTEYPFTLQASNALGESNADDAVLRAPVPTPIVSVSPDVSAPLAAATTFTADVKADQALTQVEFSFGDLSGSDTEAPYTFDVDPFTLAPGEYPLTVRATDSDGDTGEFTATVTVAAIPSRLTLDTDLSALGEIRQPVAIVVDAASQTPPQSVDFRVDGISLGTSTDLPATFTLDPFDFAAGPHTVEFVVTDVAGGEGSVAQTAQIAALPPRLTLDTAALLGEITEDAVFSVTADGQTPIESIALTLNGETETFSGVESAEFTIHPLDLAPGAHTATLIVTDQTGTAGAARVEFTVGLLPPVVAIDGLADDDVLDSPRTVTVTVGGQSEDAEVALLADTVEIARLQAPPYTFSLDPASFTEPGTHIVSVDVTNAFGASARTDIRVTVSDTVFPTVTPDIQGTAAAEAAIIAATGAAQATADTGATAQAQSTADAQAVLDATSTTQAQATFDVQSTLDGQSTASAQATLSIQATAAAIQTGTARANAASQRLATVEARATMQIQGTIDAQLTEIAQQTASALSTEDAQATLDTTQAVATQDAATMLAATAAARQAEQTSVARLTAEAQLTEDAQDLATLQAGRQATAEAANTREAVQSVASSEAAVQAEQTTVALTEAAPLATDTPAPTATPDAPTLEPTVAATEVQPTPTVFDPTSTPGEPTDVVAEGAEAPDTSVALIAVIAGILLLLVIVAMIVGARRRR